MDPLSGSIEAYIPLTEHLFVVIALILFFYIYLYFFILLFLHIHFFQIRSLRFSNVKKQFNIFIPTIFLYVTAFFYVRKMYFFVN